MRVFDYIDFDTVTIGNRRHYSISEELRLPSITTVLGAVSSPEKVASLEAWRERIGREEAERISTEAARRGTAVHDLAEIFLLKQDRVSELANDADRGLFNTIRPFLKKYVNEIWGIEKVLFSTSVGIAGRCDGIVIWDGVPSIIDFKTMSRVKSREEIEDYWIQTAFYSLAHDEMYGTNIENLVIIGAVQGGLPVIYQEPREKWLIPLINKSIEYYDKFVPKNALNATLRFNS